MGLCWITCRSRHPKQTHSIQNAFKTVLSGNILHTPIHIQPHQIDIGFQDEARTSQQKTTTHLWAPKGSRPRALRQQQFEYVHLFGAVCPATGETEAIITPVNKDIMHQTWPPCCRGNGRCGLAYQWHCCWYPQPVDTQTAAIFPRAPPHRTGMELAAPTVSRQSLF